MRELRADPPEWIFFDCFNTLIDDRDDRNDESGLGPIEHLPVQEGFFPSVVSFRSAYERIVLKEAPDGIWPEVPLDQRILQVLHGRAERGEAVHFVDRFMLAFESEYPKLLRLTPGVLPMLLAWRGRVRMGVVSNFFLPGWPEELLQKFGLRDHFEFVVDSAELGFKKPDARIYREALRRAGVKEQDAGRVVFVGDNRRNDVEAPRSLGLRAWHLDRTMPTNDPWASFRP